jgi:hypothetical protein
MTRTRLDWTVGVFFIVVAGLICCKSFWQIGNKVHDALVLTGYVTQLPRGQQQSFGYGGEREDEKVNVAFQGREMSNVSFVISRDNEGLYRIAGRDDDLLIHRTLYPANQQVELNHKDTFEVQGPLGRAAFTAFIDDESDTIRLRLKTPIFRELNVSPTRLVVGVRQDPVASPIDEIFFRVAAFGGTIAKNYRVWVQNGLLYIEEERDLAKQPDSVSASTPISPSNSNTIKEQQVGASKPQPEFLQPGETRQMGTIEVSFRQYAASPGAFLGLSLIKVFGVKLFLGILLVGLAYLVGPQARWPSGGVTIFGSVAFFVSIGLILSARDFFFFPHQQRFQEYLGILYWAALFLFALRIPFDPDSGESKRKLYIHLLVAFFCFLGVYFLIQNSFDGTTATLSSILFALIKVCLVFVVAIIISLIAQLQGQAMLRSLSASAWSEQRFRLWLLAPFVLFVLGLLAARFIFGGHEAVTLGGVRVHLPTLLLPLMVLWTAILVWTSEANQASRAAWLILSVVATLLVVLLYRLISGDNGGSTILVIGVLAVLWLGSSKKGVPLFSTIVVFLGGLGLAWINQSIRFELAWGGQEGRVLFYDSAKNLRLARDMARAGGLFGQSVALPIPAEVRSNIHSDLVAAYSIGFFGWAVFALLLLAFALFYNYLFGGLYQTLFAGKQNSDITAVNDNGGPRDILLLFGGALILAFAAQALWVVLATLLSFVPLTGLDFQPISASTISILSFFVILLGTVALAHTLNKTLPA